MKPAPNKPIPEAVEILKNAIEHLRIQRWTESDEIRRSGARLTQRWVNLDTAISTLRCLFDPEVIQ